jgi:hypothetical protein
MNMNFINQKSETTKNSVDSTSTPVIVSKTPATSKSSNKMNQIF